ncbi:hypothetical protein GGI59_006005 [Rhizobium lentis]|uniref:Uncharacterized protein n=1 Tax=Rhizobium lentis TaxID=1138194 RepID=A0A7W9CY71_9HYPH|nr:hypothetical protein [Rhizobium lentis]MBB5553732.1 hypothetical protein [Rhizobium lentis]MBB5564297.1 hypothetical protein [Rhizobium lentis]MBB5570778.1 hypothetical protein [Rhizobium lentis]
MLLFAAIGVSAPASSFEAPAGHLRMRLSWDGASVTPAVMSAASANVPHAEVRSPKGVASKHSATLLSCILNGR